MLPPCYQECYFFGQSRYHLYLDVARRDTLSTPLLSQHVLFFFQAQRRYKNKTLDNSIKRVWQPWRDFTRLQRLTTTARLHVCRRAGRMAAKQSSMPSLLSPSPHPTHTALHNPSRAKQKLPPTDTSLSSPRSVSLHVPMVHSAETCFSDETQAQMNKTNKKATNRPTHPFNNTCTYMAIFDNCPKNALVVLPCAPFSTRSPRCCCCCCYR